MKKSVSASVAVLLLSCVIATIVLPTEFLTNYQIPAHDYAPEGVFWDTTSQQFLFGSIKHGGIYAMRLGFSDLTQSAVRVVDPNNLGLGTVGVFIDYGSNRYNLWSALSNFSLTGSGTVDGGLLYVNMVTGVSSAVRLSRFQTGNGLFINDVVTDDAGNVFATNSFDGQIFKGTYNASTGTIDTTQFFYNASYHFSSGFEFNGIEFFNGWLLVGITQPASGGGGVLRINATDPTQFSMMQTTSGVIDAVDGMRFTPDKSIMYMVRSPDKLVAAVSTDSWATAQVIQNFTLPANCNPFISTIANIPSVNHQYVMCTDSFSVGPYNIAQFN